jgi:formylglycine-generating enzyme required for sulfatase activity
MGSRAAAVLAMRGRASTRARRRVPGGASAAARPWAIWMCGPVVLVALLGCGRVSHVNLGEAPTKLTKAEAIAGKAPQTLREETAPQKAEKAPLSRSEESSTMRPAATDDILADAPAMLAREGEVTLLAVPVRPAEVEDRLRGAPTALPQEQEATSPPTVVSSESPTTASPREESIEPAPRPASVTFVSTPPGATVVVNGRRLLGNTPLDNRSVPPGSSRVQFQLDDHDPVTVERRWGSGDVARLEIRLQPRPARLTLLSTPPGATVWLNGRRLIEQTPINDLSVPPGPGKIELYLRGHEPAVVERTWRPNSADRVHVKLLSPSARITFLSMPPGATVFVNGRALPGETPIRDIQIPRGNTKIEFRLDGHAPVIAEREWEPGTTDRMAVRLQPLWARVAFVSTPSGATVRVGDRVLPGKTPIENATIKPGRSTIEFKLDNYRPVTLDREWRANAADRVEVKLSPLPGRVRFETTTAWERLQIDGNPAAADTEEWRELPAGPHSVAAYSGDKVAYAEFEVAAGQAATVSLTWRRGKPDSDRYVFLPAARVVLGLEDYAKENPPRTSEMPAFWISRDEVTVNEYRPCVESGACEHPKSGENCNWGLEGRGSHPINCVSATDAEAYASWLSGRDGLPYELPTADQWERAARGETGRRYPWGDEPPSGQCNSCDRSCPFNHFKERDFDDGWDFTAPVGALEGCRGPEGIFDLVGNVAEWCRAEKPGGSYGVRGGSWGQIGAFLDPAFPSQRAASESDPTIGFRLVVTHLPGS